MSDGEKMALLQDMLCVQDEEWRKRYPASAKAYDAMLERARAEYNRASSGYDLHHMLGAMMQKLGVAK